MPSLRLRPSQWKVWKWYRFRKRSRARVMTTLPPGLTTCTVPWSDWVVRKRIRIWSKRQSPSGVKAWTGCLGCGLGTAAKVTRSSTRGSRLTRWAQAKAATVARTRSAKTRAAALGGRRGIVLADDHRDVGTGGDGFDFRAHQLQLRDRQRLGDLAGFRLVAAAEHHHA